MNRRGVVSHTHDDQLSRWLLASSILSCKNDRSSPHTLAIGAFRDRTTWRHIRFPDGFVWGAATAAAQIEGAARADGKGESIWDRFATQPGKIKNGDTPEIACDHYHRYEADFDLLDELGIAHYRLSIAWPRVFPVGRGPINTRGLDDYSRMIDALLARGITPWVTLFHWDLPQALEDRGGWLARGTVDAFARYAQEVVKRLGDRVTNWFTVNEIPCFIGNGYGNGYFAPGKRVGARELNQAYHHALLAHGFGVEAVRSHAVVRGARRARAQPPARAADSRHRDRRRHRRCAERIRANERATDGAGLPGPLSRSVPASRPGPMLRAVEPGDMERIALPTDFLGLNVYAGNFVRAGRDGRPEVLPFPRGYPGGRALVAQDHAAEPLLGGPLRGRGIRRQDVLHDRERRDVRRRRSRRRARCSICTGASICEATWSSCTEPWPKATMSAAFSSGRCSTISSGPKGTRNALESCTLHLAPSGARRSSAAAWYAEVIRNNRIV